MPRWLASWLASRKPYPYSPSESPLALCLSRNFTSADSFPDLTASFLLFISAEVWREFYEKILAWLSINFKSLGQNHIFRSYRCGLYSSIIIPINRSYLTCLKNIHKCMNRIYIFIVYREKNSDNSVRCLECVIFFIY